MSYTKIMPRGGTKYEWETMNPVLAEREMAVEYPDSGVGTGLCRFKFGDGFKTYRELPYAFDGASASSMVGGSAFAGNLFQIRADTHENWLLANPILEENELVYDTTDNCFYIGDGASRFNQLTPAGRDAKRVYDFGDEDEDDIVSPLTGGGTSGASVMMTSSPAFISNPSTPTASLSDLMSMALGAGMETQPIKGGKPFIIESVEDSNVSEESESEEGTDFGDESMEASITEEDGESKTGMTVDEFLEKNADIVDIIDDAPEDDYTSKEIEEENNTEDEATE